jgi:hypothetical protein
MLRLLHGLGDGRSLRSRIAYRREEFQAKPELRMVADKLKDQP